MANCHLPPFIQPKENDTEKAMPEGAVVEPSHCLPARDFRRPDEQGRPAAHPPPGLGSHGVGLGGHHALPRVHRRPTGLALWQGHPRRGGALGGGGMGIPQTSPSSALGKGWVCMTSDPTSTAGGKAQQRQSPGTGPESRLLVCNTDPDPCELYFFSSTSHCHAQRRRKDASGGRGPTGQQTAGLVVDQPFDPQSTLSRYSTDTARVWRKPNQNTPPDPSR